MKYKITTDTSKDGLITQQLTQDKTDVLLQWVLDTREVAIIKALTDLGWTPPNQPLKRMLKAGGIAQDAMCK